MITKGEAYFVDGIAYSDEASAKKALLRSRIKAVFPAPTGSYNANIRTSAVELILANADDVYAAMKSVLEG